MKNIFWVSQSDKNQFCAYLIETSAPRADFYFLVILSTLITALGLLANNVILVIGGMMVAPLLSPILALALGIVINDSKVILRSVKILSFSFVFAFLVAFIVGIFTLSNITETDLIKIMQPNLFVVFVAIVAGLAASYTWVKTGLNATLAGVAVTVTLIPPLAAIGLAVSKGEWILAGNVFKVFLLNVFGIIVASLIVFSLMDFYKCKKRLVEEVKEEEREIAKEKKKLESKK